MPGYSHCEKNILINIVNIVNIIIYLKIYNNNNIIMNGAFLSNENKSLIWQLLIEHKAFDNIDNNKFASVKELYENKLNEISKKTHLSLIEMNKCIISEMLNSLPFYKTQQITAPLQEVKITLDKVYEQKEAEFIKLVKPSKPSDINFNLEEDKPIDINDMNNMLDQIQRQRSNVYNNEQSTSPLPLHVNKKVTFTDDIQFISKLKQNDDSIVTNGAIIEMTNEVTNEINEKKHVETNNGTKQGINEGFNNNLMTLLYKIIDNQTHIMSTQKQLLYEIQNSNNKLTTEPKMIPKTAQKMDQKTDPQPQ